MVSLLTLLLSFICLPQNGFREGVSLGLDAEEEASPALQEAFDRGYSEAFARAKEVARLRAVASVRLGMAQQGRTKKGEVDSEALEKLHSEANDLSKRLGDLVQDEEALSAAAEKSDCRDVAGRWARDADSAIDLQAFSEKVQTVLGRTSE